MYNSFLCTRSTKEGKNIKPTVIPSKSHSAAVFITLLYCLSVQTMNRQLQVDVGWARRVYVRGHIELPKPVPLKASGWVPKMKEDLEVVAHTLSEGEWRDWGHNLGRSLIKVDLGATRFLSNDGLAQYPPIACQTFWGWWQTVFACQWAQILSQNGVACNEASTLLSAIHVYNLKKCKPKSQICPVQVERSRAITTTATSSHIALTSLLFWKKMKKIN
jgi:hypothetical protein